jgi:formylglycine-generating enzyme required for sulfatase activity/dienelactone hydrolase
MATVYLAEDVKHERKVAVKVLRPELAAVLGAERFLQEIKVTANLNHPHILPLLDSGEADGFLYYVMPYVEGETLRDRMDREGQLPLGDALQMMRQVAAALSYAHNHDVIHRDIKPENVLLSAGEAVVADFGIARAVTAAGGERLTETGIAIGTPMYMSPEQAAGDTHVDHRADVYSLGVVAYELFAGRPPFSGPTAQAVMAAHVTEPPPPITEHRQDLPQALVDSVMQCLEKQPGDRWRSADELLREIDLLAAPGGGLALVATAERRRRRAIVGLIAAFAIVIVAAAMWGSRAVRHASALRWAQEEAIPEAQRLIGMDQDFAAFRIAREVEERLGGDPLADGLWSDVAMERDIRSEPSGARVWIGEYTARDTGWVDLGTTPLTDVRVPRTYVHLRVVKDGYVPIDGAAWLPRDTFFLLAGSGTVPDGMVLVPGGETALGLPGLQHLEAVTIQTYYLGRYEVTNRHYKVFVDSGGYERPEFWSQEFMLDGRRLSSDQAVARFTDRTGRPGPSTWETGDYPTGEDDLPVAGISWYEAAAYASFAGKALPTIYHWARAAATRASAWIVPASNYGGVGASPVGSYRGIGLFGTFDMAGNVREWCANAVGNERYILGGGWNDAKYSYTDAYAQQPFDRSPTNGIRLALYEPEDESLEEAGRVIARLPRDFRTEQPVSGQVFDVYRRLYDYDRTPLNAVVEEADSSAEDWIVERVAYDAAYGERMLGYLFLPKSNRPPYQTIVYYPGSSVLRSESSRSLAPMYQIEFLVKSGRAVLYPIYKSTYERGDSLKSGYADETMFYRDHVIAWVKDYRRSIDYLETRADIDTTRLAYFGFSWGGYLGGLIPALEPRLSVIVLYVAGLWMQRAAPEAEPYNFLPRITIPVLMINGEYDHIAPVETSQRPMFDAFGTPPEHKKWLVYPGGHFVPRAVLIRETLDWLDRYLGPAR